MMKQQSSVSHFLALLGLVICFLMGMVAGCGGSQSFPSSTSPPSSVGSTNQGRATISIRWPEPSRLIPVAASSLRIEIRDSGGVVVGSQLLARPAQGGTATVTFDPLPIGNLTATATAFPNSDGTGVAQATATTPLVIQAGQITSFRLAMGSTIDHIEVTPPSLFVLPGGTAALTVSAKDAGGNVVLIASGQLQWVVGDTTVADVDANGNVTGKAGGATLVTVTDAESGKSVAVPLTTGFGVGDNFDDNQTDTNFWQVVTTGTGPIVAEANQRLEVTLPSSSGGLPAFEGGYRTRRSFRGDFDVQVDYQLLTWPQTNGVRVGVTVTGAKVQRTSLSPFEFPNDPRESYTGTHGIIEDYIRVATTATAGTLRLVRVNGVYTSYFRDADHPQWVLLISGENDTDDQPISLLVWSSDTEFQHNTVKVAFDNFVVNQGQFAP